MLRARNQELREKLREKEEWLNEWQKEMESLGEFQRLEIKTLEESFERRVVAPSNERVRKHHLLCLMPIQQSEHQVNLVKKNTNQNT